MDAVVRRDVPLAQALIIRDLRLDTLQSEVERRALAFRFEALAVDGLDPGYVALYAVTGVATMLLVVLLSRAGLVEPQLLVGASGAIMGLIGSRKGSIKVHGQETIGLPTHRIARLGPKPRLRT